MTDKEGGCSPPPIANIRIRKDYIVPSSGRAPPLVVSFFYPAVNSCGVSRHEDPRWNGGKERGGEKWVDVRDDGLLDYPPSRDFELESLGNQRVALTRKIVSFRENAGLLSLMNNWSGKRVGLCDPCSRRVSRLLSWLQCEISAERERERLINGFFLERWTKMNVSSRYFEYSTEEKFFKARFDSFRTNSN